eukprot:m.486951 g.486951  ORF g.486951 m.486951 type:complete len:65 (-) comp57216_c3_seq28:977-1171(-)
MCCRRAQTRFRRSQAGIPVSRNLGSLLLLQAKPPKEFKPNLLHQDGSPQREISACFDFPSIFAS